MDAATLYIVLTLPNGGNINLDPEVPDIGGCEARAEWRRQLDRLDHQLPSTLYRCEGHNRFALLLLNRRGKSRHLVEFSSREACTAYQWIAYLTRPLAPQGSVIVLRDLHPNRAGMDSTGSGSR